MTTRLPVTVEVDPSDGHWSVDGLPMILVPRHLITNNLQATEERLGAADTAKMLHASGYRSAQQWCAHQAARRGLDGADIVRHYLDQLSRRGWGQFSVPELDLANGFAKVCVNNSALAHRDTVDGSSACYLYAGWFEGALDYVRPGAGSAPAYTAREVECAAAGADRCLFEVTTDRS